MDDGIQGDVIVVYGDLKLEIKFVNVERFTQVIANLDELTNSNKFYSRILLATAGSIGAGLDFPVLYLACWAGFPTRIFKMVQEIGRRGRGRTKHTGIVTDNFYLMLSCENFIHLNTRLFQSPIPIPRNITLILSTRQEREIQQNNIMLLLKMIVLKRE